jgi:hypothetical protein
VPGNAIELAGGRILEPNGGFQHFSPGE